MGLYAFPKYYYVEYHHGQSLDQIKQFVEEHKSPNAGTAHYSEHQDPNDNNTWQLSVSFDNAYPFELRDGAVLMNNGGSFSSTYDRAEFDKQFAYGTLFGN